jgi:diphthamide biosynthesis methyltransferase
MDFEKLAHDFNNGGHLLRVLAAWAQVMENPQAITEQLLEFERAYAELVRLYDEAKIQGNREHFSEETLTAIRRINHLIQAGLDSPHSTEHAGEIHTLATECIQKFAPEDSTTS